MRNKVCMGLPPSVTLALLSSISHGLINKNKNGGTAEETLLWLKREETSLP